MSEIKDTICQNSKFIDVFFGINIPQNIKLFFSSAKGPKPTYEDETVCFCEYSCDGKTYKKTLITKDEQLHIDTYARNQCVERFRKNKYADIEFVDALILSESEQVFLNSHFNFGDLKGDYTKTRINAYGKDDLLFYQSTIDKIQEIVCKVKDGKILRVWYGHNALDLCGLMRLLYELKDINCRIIEFELPDEVRMPNGRIRKNCKYWDQFHPEELCIPISNAKFLSQEKISALLTKWQKCVDENTEYRIYENGVLKSVNFEYLRAKAISHFYKNKFSLTKLMGRLIKKEDAFKDLCVLSAFPNFIYRLIEAGDVEFLGYRTGLFEGDCWLRSLRQD